MDSQPTRRPDNCARNAWGKTPSYTSPQSILDRRSSRNAKPLRSTAALAPRNWLRFAQLIFQDASGPRPAPIPGHRGQIGFVLRLSPCAGRSVVPNPRCCHPRQRPGGRNPKSAIERLASFCTIYPRRGPRHARRAHFRTPGARLGSFCVFHPPGPHPISQIGFVLHILPSAGWRRQATARASGCNSVSNPQSEIRNPQSRHWLRFARLIPAGGLRCARPRPFPDTGGQIGFVSQNRPPRPPPPSPVPPGDARDWLCSAQTDSDLPSVLPS